jgi:hypothetical protein
MTLIFAFWQGFLGPAWAKPSGEIHLDSRAIGGLWERCISPLFWQTERYLSVFSTGTEKKAVSGFSGINRRTKEEKEPV